MTSAVSFLFAGDFVPILFEHGGHSIFADEVARAYGDEADAFALKQILNLPGEVLIALYDESLKQVGMLVAKFGVID